VTNVLSAIVSEKFFHITNHAKKQNQKIFENKACIQDEMQAKTKTK
jgi:hypothetical protein